MEPIKTSNPARAKSKLRWAFCLVAILLAVGFLAVALNTGSSYSKRRATVNTMKIVCASINMYYQENAAYPDSVRSLVPLYIAPNLTIRDRWFRDFHYQPSTTDPKRPYALQSKGEDGVLNTADDIDIWTINQ